MMEPFLIFMGGLLGSTHCVGMCGGFVIALGTSSAAFSQGLKRQLVYRAGRIATYSFLGAIAGYGGQRLYNWVPDLIHMAAVLCILAGVLLLAQGALAAGLFPQKRGTPVMPCMLGPVFRSFLTSPDYWNALTAGILTGFLPCGLVYAFISLAVSSRHVLGGLLIMALFGLGTMPLMVFTGLGAGQLSLPWRAKLLRLAAVCVMATGALTIYRSVSYVHHADETRSACPFCAPK